MAKKQTDYSRGYRLVEHLEGGGNLVQFAKSEGISKQRVSQMIDELNIRDFYKDILKKRKSRKTNKLKAFLRHFDRRYCNYCGKQYSHALRPLSVYCSPYCHDMAIKYRERIRLRKYYNETFNGQMYRQALYALRKEKRREAKLDKLQK